MWLGGGAGDAAAAAGRGVRGKVARVSLAGDVPTSGRGKVRQRLCGEVGVGVAAPSFSPQPRWL